MSDSEVWIRRIKRAFDIVQSKKLSVQEKKEIQDAIDDFDKFKSEYAELQGKIEDLQTYLDRHGYGEGDEPEG